jgi:hypothetical protein
VVVLAVERDLDEWIVSFTHPRSNRKIFARTHKHAIAEIACTNDLLSAKQRWKHTVIFSKRGVITTPGNNSNTSYSSLRVSLLDSLIVTDVTWGMTPLPVKPILLMVTSQATGKTGFIPVRCSWTNTLADEIKEQSPWNEDIYEQDPRSIYNWEDYTWEVINNHRVILEMTQEQVRLSWGEPEKSEKNENGTGTEHYVYPSHELLFENGILTSIQERQ